MFPILPIFTPFVEALDLIKGTLIEEKPGKKKNTTQFTFQNDFGNYIVTVLNGQVHEVIYQIETPLEANRKEKYYFILGQYQQKSKFIFLADNGFGYLFKREDEVLYANYSYAMDIWTIGSMELRAHV